jgi:hypothetical protein
MTSDAARAMIRRSDVCRDVSLQDYGGPEDVQAELCFELNDAEFDSPDPDGWSTWGHVAVFIGAVVDDVAYEQDAFFAKFFGVNVQAIEETITEEKNR